MRKRLIPPIPHDVPHPDKGWPDLGRVAVAEVTSEEKEYPVEAALVAGKLGLACSGSGTSNDPATLRSTARAQTQSRSFPKKPRHRVPKSLACDGLRMADTRFEKLCVSSGISAHLTLHARWRNITLNFRMSPFLNCS